MENNRENSQLHFESHIYEFDLVLGFYVKIMKKVSKERIESNINMPLSYVL